MTLNLLVYPTIYQYLTFECSPVCCIVDGRVLNKKVEIETSIRKIYTSHNSQLNWEHSQLNETRIL